MEREINKGFFKVMSKYILMNLGLKFSLENKEYCLVLFPQIQELDFTLFI